MINGYVNALNGVLLIRNYSLLQSDLYCSGENSGLDGLLCIIQSLGMTNWNEMGEDAPAISRLFSE